MSLSPSRGVIYVATGDRYVREAAESLASLRRTNPGLPAAIASDQAAPSGDWDRVIPLPDPTRSLRDKVSMRLAPWDRVLFLDTDTYIAADLSPLFDMLDHGFDVIGHQLFEGHNYELEGVPHAFPEFNTGVIGFRQTPDLQALFDAWRTWYDHFRPLTACDQRSFRKALYESRLRHAVLPPEYNFRPVATNFAVMNLRILHGRPVSDMDDLRELIDVRLVHRAYVPRLGCVVSDHMTLRQVWRLWVAAGAELVKTVSRPLRQWPGRLSRRSPRATVR